MLKSLISYFSQGDVMGFCSRCGKKISDEDYFCFHCGAKTKKGAEKGVSSPSDEMREALARMGQEMEKAFQIAAKEIQKAFKTARENVKQTRDVETVVCSDCSATSPSDAIFCYKCGKELDKD
jgi:predicted amidophosphoribosyltransferase